MNRSILIYFLKWNPPYSKTTSTRLWLTSISNDDFQLKSLGFNKRKGKRKAWGGGGGVKKNLKGKKGGIKKKRKRGLIWGEEHG